MQKIDLKPLANSNYETIGHINYKDIDIPSGYIIDGKGRPTAFGFMLTPFSPEYCTAVAVYDYLTDNAARLYIKLGNAVDFKAADLLMREVLKELGVAGWKAQCFYLASRIYHSLKYR